MHTSALKLVLLSFFISTSYSQAAISPLEGTCEFNGQIIMNEGIVTAYQNSTVPAGSTCASETRRCVDGVLYGSFAYASCTIAQPASCLFNGQTIAHGGTVTAYTNSTVPYGVSCSSVVQIRTCDNGVLSGNAAYSSCETNAPRACLFNGVTIDHGDEVTAFQSSSTQYGGVCTSQQRVCNDGTLSGSYQYSVCNIDAPASCLFDGRTLAHGEIVTAFAQSSAPFGEACQSESRTCDNGVLSGSHSFSSCSVGLPASCTFDGNTLAHGESVTAYAAASVPFGNSCQSQARSCHNGVLSGTFSSSSCSVEPAANCSINGATVEHGSSITMYQQASVAYGQTCQSQQRACNNGTLSGDYNSAACIVEPAAPCSINGTSVQHGSSITMYQQSSVPFGQTCQSQQRTCTNGALSGSATFSSCTVQNAPPAANCSFNGQTVANGQSIVAYQSSSVAFGQTCSIQTRVCSNGSLSGNYTNSSCSVAQPASCNFNGQTIAHNQSVVGYEKLSVAFGQLCKNQTRLCNNGVLSGTYANSSCSVAQPASCTFNGNTVASGSSVTAFPKASVAYGQKCEPEKRTCTHGVLSGSAAFGSCVVGPAPQPPGTCAIKNLIWDFPEKCVGHCGYGNGYFKSRVSRDGGKTWTYITKQNLPEDLQQVWNYLVKKYGTSQCGRPRGIYLPVAVNGYIRLRPEALPGCDICKFVEVTVDSSSRRSCGGHKKSKSKKVLKFVCESR